MTYLTSKKTSRIENLKRISSHPYFGFIVLGLILLLVQSLQIAGFLKISLVISIGNTMVYVIVALGFSILLGYGGLASLGTAGFVGLGTYIMGYLTKNSGLPLIAIIAIAILFAVVIGGTVGFISLRIEGMYLAIITLGLSEIFNEVFKNAVKFTNGTNGFLIKTMWFLGIPLKKDEVYIVISILLVVVMIFTLNIIKSPTGRALTAMKNSDSAAQAMGISILKYRLLAFVISTVYAVFAGLLYMGYTKFTIPTTWTLAFSLNILAAVIVGGPRSIWGIVLGTFMIFGLDNAVLKNIEFFQNNPNISIIFNGLLIVLVVMFYPGGLSRLLQSIKYNYKVKKAKLITKWREYRYGKDE